MKNQFCKFCGRSLHVVDHKCAVCQAKLDRGFSLTIRFPIPPEPRSKPIEPSELNRLKGHAQ